MKRVMYLVFDVDENGVINILPESNNIGNFTVDELIDVYACMLDGLKTHKKLTAEKATP